MTSPFAHHWKLDPETIYLNHGSFGPAPVEVCQAREAWSARLQQQPMKFFCEEMENHLDEAASALARFLQTKPHRLALTDNATTAMNIAAATIDLNPGDEVLLTDHEYGAVRNIWIDRCRSAGANLVFTTLPFPLRDDQIIGAIESAVSERTRVIVVSHVTSPTAAILPVRDICRMAKSKGIITVVDGPHAIAMLDVNLGNLGCDFYCASCHKWLCGPFGSGFLWAHPKHHSAVKMPLVGWGGSISGRSPSWQDSINWTGTRDPAAVLSIPAAISFLSSQKLSTFRSHAHELVLQARRQLLEIDEIGPLCTPEESDFVSMVAVELPQPTDWKPGYHGHPDALQLELKQQHKIETPVGSWNGKRFLRVSAHLYNDADQIDRLTTAVKNAKHLRS